MNNYAASIKYGVIAGVIMIAIISGIYAVNVDGLASMLPRVAYVVLIFAMIWGGITVRRQLGNYSGFGHAFLTVFIISFTATMMFDSFNYVLYTVVNPKIPAIIKARLIADSNEMAEKLGLNDEKREALLADLKNADYSYTTIVLFERYASSIIIGAIFSVVIGLFVNRPDARPVEKAGV